MFALAVVFFAFLDLPINNVPVEQCGIKLSDELIFVYKALHEHRSILLNKPVCDSLIKASRLAVDKLFVTHGYVSGRNVVCLSDDVTNPCSLVIGSIDSDFDPRDALKKAFNYREKIDFSQPLEESIERLLLRPAEIIYPQPPSRQKGEKKNESL